MLSIHARLGTSSCLQTKASHCPLSARASVARERSRWKGEAWARKASRRTPHVQCAAADSTQPHQQGALQAAEQFLSHAKAGNFDGIVPFICDHVLEEASVHLQIPLKGEGERKGGQDMLESRL